MTASTPEDAAERIVERFQLVDAAEKRRALVIANPYATTVSDRVRNLVVYALAARYEVDAVETQSSGHATEICREAAHEGYDVVIAFGGDGTVNEVVNGLAGSQTPLCVLPGGTTNVYCRLLGIPSEIVDATEHVLRMADHWEPRRVDLAALNDRLFAFSAGVGIDALVVRRVDAHPQRKARWGAPYFVWCAVTTFSRRYVLGHAPRLRVSTGEREIDGVAAIVQNAQHYTFYKDRPVDVGEGATLDGGTLSGAVVERAAARDIPSFLLRELTQRLRLIDHRKVAPFSGVRELTIVSADERPLPLQVDGDYAGEAHEVRFEVRPGALLVVS